MMNKRKISILGIISAVFSLALLIGSLTFFKSVCGADMHCHQANTVITIMGAVMFALSLIAVFLKNKVGAILSFLTTVCGVVTALIPGVIMPLCMMADMSCQAAMKPWTILLSAAVALFSLLGGIICIRKK